MSNGQEEGLGWLSNLITAAAAAVLGKAPHQKAGCLVCLKQSATCTIFMDMVDLREKLAGKAWLHTELDSGECKKLLEEKFKTGKNRSVEVKLGVCITDVADVHEECFNVMKCIQLVDILTAHHLAVPEMEPTRFQSEK
eukprot:627463-Pelagomonas_calceolata.AAC.3